MVSLQKAEENSVIYSDMRVVMSVVTSAIAGGQTGRNSARERVQTLIPRADDACRKAFTQNSRREALLLSVNTLLLAELALPDATTLINSVLGALASIVASRGP